MVLKCGGHSCEMADFIVGRRLMLRIESVAERGTV